MKKSALIFISNGTEEIEVVTPLDYLRRAGVETVLCAAGEWSSGNVVECSHGLKVVADCNIMDFSENDAAGKFDAVIVPGGMPGTKHLAEYKSVVDIVNLFGKSAEKLVCAICAAPALVISRSDVLKGKKWTCYPGMEAEAGDCAENHVSGVPFVHDKNLITARGPGAAEEFAMEIVRTLCGDGVADKIKTGSVQR